MNRTPLFDQHHAAGAKLIDFAGWEMPIQYTGVVDEYQTVRSKAGLFDVSHMGRIFLSGPGASAFLQTVTTNDVAALAVSQAQYSMVCNEDGGIKDDIFVYRLAPEKFLLCVNASNRAKITDWLQKQPRDQATCRIEDRSAATAQIALQGPTSRAIMAGITTGAVAELKLHHVCETKTGGVPCVVARTGYTGEYGYELYLDAEQAGQLWNALMQQGRGLGLKPAGLGARDLLRLEMGYLLYGNDIGEDTTPLEAGAGWVVKLQKGDFIGRKALVNQAAAGPSRKLIAFELRDKGVPRHGCKIVSGRGNEVLGEVTSGNLSPLLQKGIGLGYVPRSHAAPSTAIRVDIRGKLFDAAVVTPPFYQKPKTL